MEHDPEGTKAALYVRVSTDKQTVANQIEALTAVALARGWEVVVDMRKNKIRPAPRPCRPPIAEVYKHALGCRYFASRIAIYATPMAKNKAFCLHAGEQSAHRYKQETLEA